MNILAVSTGTILGKENCAAMENISSQPISFFKLHASYRNVPRLTQMLVSWTTLSSQQRKKQPCVTVCCFTETEKIKD